MGLLSLGQQIFDGARQLYDNLQKPTATGANDGLSETNKSAPVGLWASLFGGKNTATPTFNNAGLNFTAQSVNLSGNEIEVQNSREAARLNLAPPQQTGYVQVPVVLPHNHPTPTEEARAILTGLKFKDADIQAYNQHYQTDLVKDMSVGLGGKNLNHNAGRRVYVPAEKKDVYVGYIAIDSKTHRNLKNFLEARRTGGELPANSINNARPNNKPANITLDPVTVTVIAGTTAGVAGVLVETMPPQIATDIVPRAMETVGKVAPLVAEIVPPVTMIAAEALPTVMIADHAAKTYIEAEDKFNRGQAAQTYDAAQELAKATATTMTMDDAAPLPLPVPESKPNERPYATPKAPAVPDIGTAPQVKPGELVKPDVKPDVQAKPQTKVDNLPQPYTPDVPQGTPPQQKPPITPLDIAKAIGATTAGTAAGIGSKKAVDSISVISQTQDIQQVKYGSTELSQATIQFRKDNGIWSNVNLAAFKYQDKDGSMKIEIRKSDRDSNKHSEQVLDKWLQEQGIPRENVKEIYSELAPCVPRMPQNCDKMLREKYPDAKVTYSYEYGATRESRVKGVEERANDLKEIKKNANN